MKKFNIKYLIAVLGLFFETGLVKAQVQNAPLPDSAELTKMILEKKIPILGVAYLDSGKVVFSKVLGELKPGVSAPKNTLFNVASITKTITTMVTLRLVNSGQWSLDEPIYHYWTDPDVRDDPRSKKLTTWHILTHQTGFPNWRGMLPSKKLAFQFDPGTKFQYSGEGMQYLRHALEHKFHRTLEQLADSLIFRPLDMKDTHMTWRDDMLDHFAVPYDVNGKELPIDKNTEPSGDLLKTTVADYARFMTWVVNGAGLKPELFRQMTSPLAKIKNDKYMGLGWAVYTNLPSGRPGLSHSGHDDGVNTLVIVLPDSKRGLLIFTDSDNGWMVYSDLVHAFLKTDGERIAAIEMAN